MFAFVLLILKWVLLPCIIVMCCCCSCLAACCACCMKGAGGEGAGAVEPVKSETEKQVEA